jgi:hypothetical protein
MTASAIAIAIAAKIRLRPRALLLIGDLLGFVASRVSIALSQ